MRPLRAIAARALALACLASAVGLGAGIGAAKLVLGRGRDEALAELRRVALHLETCSADPSHWVGRGDPATFAYDGTTLVALNAVAPAYMGARALAVGEVNIQAPATPFGPTTIALRASERGPCAVLQRHWPRQAPAAAVQTIGIAAIGTGLMITLVLGVVVLVRPLLRSVALVAASASEVGRPEGYLAPKDLESEDLQRIVVALSNSHERILAAEACAAARLHALERHLAEVAHDLRTPLTALQLSVEEASERSDNGEVQAILARALSESVYLAGLTENLRLSARMRETGTFGSERWRVDLREIIERVCSRLRILARRKAMTFHAQLGDQPVLAECSPLAVERALSNVIENAVVHGHSGGAVEVRLVAGSLHFLLSVEDDGPGLDGSGGTSRAGSGLGMRITREVATDAGWEVSVAPLVPSGTRVAISGPRAALSGIRDSSANQR